MSWQGDIGKVVKIERGDGEISSFEWRIPDFPSLDGKRGDYYTSPTFNACDGVWFLRIFPYGLRDPPSDSLTLVLRRWDIGPPQTLDVTLGIRGVEGVENKRERRQEFSEDDYECYCRGFCSRSKLEEQNSRLMPGNALIVSLDMRIVMPKVARGQQSSDECDICCEAPIDCVLNPCGHMIWCYNCALRFWEADSPRCPMCRKSIQTILKIYRK